MYTGRALKSNIEWLIIRIQTARNRSRLGKSSIIFKSLCWSSRALLCNGFKFVCFMQSNDDDIKIPPELQIINDILMKSDLLFDNNRLIDAKNILDQYTVSYCYNNIITEQSSDLINITNSISTTAIFIKQKSFKNINNDFDLSKIPNNTIGIENELQDQTIPEIKWRQARLLYSLSKLTKDRNEKKTLIENAYELIKSALSKCNEHFAIHKWMAIILDAKVEYDGIKSRIMQICNIRKHMEQAVKLNPNDPTIWYFLGSYEFGLADLSWLHKRLLKCITNTKIPNGSYEKAFKHFQYAENLSPEFYSKNLLMLGKCSIALQKLHDAKKFLRKVTNFHVINREDQHCQKEAVELLRRIGTVKCE